MDRAADFAAQAGGLEIVSSRTLVLPAVTAPIAGLKQEDSNMKFTMPILLGAVLVAGCVAPAAALPKPITQTDQDRDRERNSQAYKDGFAQGQSDARAGAALNDQPTAQWTKDDDMQAYRQGYRAGYDNVRKAGGHGSEDLERQARQFGYEDGLAAGQSDVRTGRDFHPEHGESYEHAVHGWNPDMGSRDEFQQLYRQSYVRGYEAGYKGTEQR
jgi:hypothetical protein